MAPAATVISSGAACWYGADGKRIDDTLSREISHRNAARTIRGGDFSTPLRFGRNDEDGAGRLFCHLGREISPLRSATVEMTGGGGPAFFIICGEAATTTLGAKGPVKLKNPPAKGRSILRTFPSEPFEPSHRRCVQWRPPPPSSRAGLRVGMGQMENALMIL